MADKPKILVIDIETKPTLAYVWKGWKENIGVDQIVDASKPILCVGAKWVGGPTEFYSVWEHGYEQMLLQTHRMLSEADMVVGVNHEKFDIPIIMGEFATYGIAMPPPLTLMDLQKFWKKKMRFFSNRLAFVGPTLSSGYKLKHEGFELWVKVMDGVESAQNKMKRYCLQDVRVTEKLWKKLKPYITTLPNVFYNKSNACGGCGGTDYEKRGYRFTKTMRIHRLRCKNPTCGAWRDGKREMIKYEPI